MDPDPLVRGTDPMLRIGTKMSRIPYTGSNIYLFFLSPVGQIAKPMTSGLKSLGSNIVTMNKAGLEKTRVFFECMPYYFFVNKG